MGTGGWLWLLIIGLIGLSIFGFVQLGNNKEKKSSLAGKIKSSDFNPDTILAKVPVSIPVVFGAAIDRSSNKICLIEGEAYRYINGSDLIESEVLVDGSTVTKTSRASQFSGAAIGGVLFGGVGAVVGGLSGSKTTSVKVKGVKLRLVVNDIHKPFHEIDFIEMTATGNTPPDLAVKEANEWHSLFSTIIKINERQAAIEEKQALIDTPSTKESFSDEIKSVYDLFLNGALTEEEFNGEKKKIIDKWKN